MVFNEAFLHITVLAHAETRAQATENVAVSSSHLSSLQPVNAPCFPFADMMAFRVSEPGLPIVSGLEQAHGEGGTVYLYKYPCHT